MTDNIQITTLLVKDSGNLPDLDVQGQEIADDLQKGLDQTTAIAGELRE